MQPPTTINNHPELPTTTYNHPQPPKKRPTSTQKLPKKAKRCHKQLRYSTSDVNTETDVDFETMVYIHVYVSVCIYFISHYIY